VAVLCPIEWFKSSRADPTKPQAKTCRCIPAHDADDVFPPFRARRASYRRQRLRRLKWDRGRLRLPERCLGR
jgi:hypothetical protein